jgi:streptogramin lyase
MIATPRRLVRRAPGPWRPVLIAALVAGCASPGGASPGGSAPPPTPSSGTPSIAVSSATPDAVPAATPAAVPAMTSVEPAGVIDVPGASGFIAVVTDGTTVWAAADGAILRIDAATNKAERLPAPTHPDDTTMAFADDGLWVTRWEGHRLYRLDPRTGKVLLSVDLPKPVKIAFIGEDLWVGLENAHKMVIVDRTTGELGRSVDAGAYGVAGLGDLWFASDHSTTIKRVDPASGSVKATIEGKGEDNCIITGVFPDNVWLSCFGRDIQSRSATRIDPATNTVAAVATVPPSHGGSVTIIDGEAWFVGSFEDASGNPFGGLLRIDPATGAIERFVSIGPADPHPPVLAAGAAWFADEAGHRILRVNLADLVE